MTVSTADLPIARTAEFSRRRIAIGFMNWAHALDHFVILIYPTVVIELEVVYGRSYSALIALATASFVAFGLFSLPAGWLGDRWSRRNLMVTFYLGCGVSLIGAAFAPSLYVLGFALFSLGMFAAIYHPVGTAVILENATVRGRTLAFNGVCGNLGVSLAAGITATLTAAFSWRGAFLVPGVICVATGLIYPWLVSDDEKHRAAARSTTRGCVAAVSDRGDAIRSFRHRRVERRAWCSTRSRSRCRRSSMSASATTFRCSRSAA